MVVALRKYFKAKKVQRENARFYASINSIPDARIRDEILAAADRRDSRY